MPCELADARQTFLEPGTHGGLAAAPHDGWEGVLQGGRLGPLGACWQGPVLCPRDTHTVRTPGMAAEPDLWLEGQGEMSVCDRGRAEGPCGMWVSALTQKVDRATGGSPLPGPAMSHFFHQPLSPLQLCCLTLWLFCGRWSRAWKGQIQGQSRRDRVLPTGPVRVRLWDFPKKELSLRRNGPPFPKRIKSEF